MSNWHQVTQTLTHKTMQTKEEIIRDKVNLGNMYVVHANIANVMQIWADQQTAALQSRVEKLELALLGIQSLPFNTELAIKIATEALNP
jgi:hypothetical protein